MQMQKSNIVNIPRRRIFTMPLDQLDSYQGRRAIAKLLREWLQGHDGEGKKRTINTLASRAKLNHTTVSRIADETTKWPRLHTILSIMAGLGFKAVSFE